MCGGRGAAARAGGRRFPAGPRVAGLGGGRPRTAAVSGSGGWGERPGVAGGTGGSRGGFRQRSVTLARRRTLPLPSPGVPGALLGLRHREKHRRALRPLSLGLLPLCKRSRW